MAEQSEKLPWEEIKKRFTHEWVQLIDYSWDETKPDPSSGVVRLHSSSRKEFDKLLRQGPPQKDSAIVYVGHLRFPKGAIFNANQHQWFRTTS